MGKKKPAVVLFLVIIAFGIIYFVSQHFMYVTTDNAQVEAPTVMLAAKVGGYVTKIEIKDHQFVKKDEVILELDDRDYQNALNQVKSELSSVDIRMKDAEKSFRRIANLYSSGSVAQQQYDSSSSQYNDVKAKFGSLTSIVAEAELNLHNTKVRAPFDGWIAKKSAEAGQFVTPGTPLVGFVGANERWVMANFKETEVSKIHVGSQAFISVDAIPGKTFLGEVTSLSSATGATFTLLPPDNATGNFTKVVQRVPVKIKFKNITPEELLELRNGYSVEIKISTARN